MSHNRLELSSPLKQRRETPKLTPKKVLGETSNNVRLHDIYLNTSPIGKNQSTTPKKGGAAQPPISPWRIRVIVQAEPENENDNTETAKHFMQPSVGRTVTTIVPLKQAGGSVVDAQKRSGVTPQKKSSGKRPGTPKPKRPDQHDITSMSLLKSKNDVISQSATTPKRSRGRPRKGQGRRSELSGETPENRKTATHVSPLDDLAELGLLEGMTEPRRRGRRKAAVSTKQVTYPDVHQGIAQGLQLGLKMNEKESDFHQVNGLKRKIDTTFAPDETQRIKKSRIVGSSSHTDADKTIVPTAPHTQEHSHQDSHSNHENAWARSDIPISDTSASLDIQLNSKFAEPSVASSDVEESTQGRSTRSYQFSDPTHEHCEFDTILESEGFSMISVSTLPSGKVGLNITNHDRQSNERDPNLETSLENDNFRTILSPGLQRSSEAAAQHQLGVLTRHQKEVLSVSAVGNIERSDSRQTPSHMSLEPSNLPSIRPVGSHDAPRVLDEISDGTPKIVRVVRAGAVLQGVMGPRELAEVSCKWANQESKLSKSPGTGSESESKNLFDGFGAGTQRELRAGLRLGEELARSLAGRTSQTSPRNTVPEHHASTQTTTLDSLGTSHPKEDSGNGLTLPSAGQNVSYPVLSNHQLPSPDRSETNADEDQMSLDADTSTQGEESVGEDYDSQSDEGIDGASHISHNRTMEREAEWQREREEVVKQIEMANSSRVIVIDGDTDLHDEQLFQAGDTEEIEDSDIWQAEAHSSDADLNSSDHRSHSDTQNQVSKPRRSQIPSSWRREERLAPAVQGDIGSDLFWQPRRVATTAIEANEERNSDHDASNSNHPAKQRELLESSRCNQRDKNSEAATGPNPSPPGGLYISSTDDLPDGDLNGRCVETRGPVVVPESMERDKHMACQHNRSVDLLQTRSTRLSIHQTKVRKISNPNDHSSGLSASRSNAATTSSSWRKYITSFLPSWNQPTLPKPLPQLPNGQRRLPTATSDGPLCIYLPWTLDHWKALYVHYAAAREGRATYRFNRSGPTAWHVGVSHQYRQWRKSITEEDSAIADAFLSDLRRRGIGTPPHNGVLIDDYKVLGMLFYIWKAGVMNGDCEVGVGTTGWQTGSEEWWRPDMESWFRG